MKKKKTHSRPDRLRPRWTRAPRLRQVPARPSGTWTGGGRYKKAVETCQKKTSKNKRKGSGDFSVKIFINFFLLKSTVSPAALCTNNLFIYILSNDGRITESRPTKTALYYIGSGQSPFLTSVAYLDYFETRIRSPACIFPDSCIWILLISK